jgi:hypothetical protein
MMLATQLLGALLVHRNKIIKRIFGYLFWFWLLSKNLNIESYFHLLALLALSCSLIRVRDDSDWSYLISDDLDEIRFVAFSGVSTEI